MKAQSNWKWHCGEGWLVLVTPFHTFKSGIFKGMSLDDLRYLVEYQTKEAYRTLDKIMNDPINKIN